MIIKKSKKIISFIILFLIFIFFISLYFKNNFQNQDLLIPFLKLNQNKNTENNMYYFHVLYQNKNLQKINLINTMNNKTEKMQPGSCGEFEIGIISNQNMYVNMEIVNKPENILFYVQEEKIKNNYFYKINKNELKKIKIKWEWKYEVSELENKKDTEKGRELEEYQFIVRIKGEEVI